MSKEVIVQTVVLAELVVQYTAGNLHKWQVVQQCQEGLFDGILGLHWHMALLLHSPCRLKPISLYQL